MSKSLSIFGSAACTLLAAVIAGTAPATAFNPPFAWWGSMVILTTTGAACGGGIIPGDGPAIVFRPKLETAEVNSALTYTFGHSSGIIKKANGSLQFNGSGSYAGRFLSGRAEEVTNTGTFNLAVSPAIVTPSTDFVQFTGIITNFSGRLGCNVTVRGSASRRL
jgi:hypothetical protein